MSVKVKKNEKTLPQSTESKAPSSQSSAHPLLALREEVDHLFDRFFSGFALGPFSDMRWNAMRTEPFRRLEDAFSGLSPSLGSLSMKVDIHETDGVYCIDAEMPGFEEKDIEVSADDHVLTITGKKSEQKKEDRENYHVSERHFGSTSRRFPIPETANLSKAEADFKNGVLHIKMPMKAVVKAKATKIPIKSS